MVETMSEYNNIWSIFIISTILMWIGIIYQLITDWDNIYLVTLTFGCAIISIIAAQIWIFKTKIKR